MQHLTTLNRFISLAVDLGNMVHLEKFPEALVMYERQLVIAQRLQDMHSEAWAREGLGRASLASAMGKGGMDVFQLLRDRVVAHRPVGGR